MELSLFPSIAAICIFLDIASVISGSGSNIEVVLVDTEARKKIYAQVQRLAADDLPYVSLWWVDNVAVMNRRLAGFEAYPNGSLRSLATLTLIGPAGGEPSQ